LMETGSDFETLAANRPGAAAPSDATASASASTSDPGKSLPVSINGILSDSPGQDGAPPGVTTLLTSASRFAAGKLGGLRIDLDGFRVEVDSTWRGAGVAAFTAMDSRTDTAGKTSPPLPPGSPAAPLAAAADLRTARTVLFVACASEEDAGAMPQSSRSGAQENGSLSEDSTAGEDSRAIAPPPGDGAGKPRSSSSPRPLEAFVTVPIPPGRVARVFALDGDGAPGTQMPLWIEGTTATFHVGRESASLWYAIRFDER